MKSEQMLPQARERSSELQVIFQFHHTPTIDSQFQYNRNIIQVLSPLTNSIPNFDQGAKFLFMISHISGAIN